MGTYNTRVYKYKGSTHMSLYARPNKKRDNTDKPILEVIHDDINDLYGENEFSKSNKNENRTKEQEDHCINQSLNSTKNRIYNITRSNDWEWFITLTFNRDFTDASVYNEIIGKFSNFMDNLRRRKAPDLKYLIVPEFHSDGKNYHFHGLLSNTGNMRITPSGRYTKDNEKIYHVKDWSWGYTTATRVISSERSSSYITKYITKESVAWLPNKKRYYCNRGIERVQPDFFNVPHDDLIMDVAPNIAYMNTITVPKAYQKITYIEVDDLDQVK